MIYTSYFAKLKSLPENVIPVSICAKAPDWYDGLQYKKLAPTYETLMNYKKDKNEDAYVKAFNQKTLDNKNAMDTACEIYDLLTGMDKEIVEMTNCPCWANPRVHIALICYEKASDFCHRHLVADWLRENGIKCTEWQETE